MKILYFWLLFSAANCAAIVAGIFYAFSSFVMSAFDRLPVEQGVNAMKNVNVTVYAPSFIWLFMGTTIICAALAFWSLYSIKETGGQLTFAASLIFLISTFGVTTIFNVPLANQLAAAPPSSAVAMWSAFSRDFTWWNSVRTTGAMASSMLFTLALLRN